MLQAKRWAGLIHSIELITSNKQCLVIEKEPKGGSTALSVDGEPEEDRRGHVPLGLHQVEGTCGANGRRTVGEGEERGESSSLMGPTGAARREEGGEEDHHHQEKY